jgi:hypothetical protein
MSNKISLEKDVHYKESEGYLKVPKVGIIRQPYIQAGENISVKRIGEEEFEFQIDGLRPFIINPQTDLSNLSDITIEQLAEEMYLCGESSDDNYRFAKFSKTRKHLKNYQRPKINTRKANTDYHVSNLTSLLRCKNCKKSSNEATKDQQKGRHEMLSIPSLKSFVSEFTHPTNYKGKSKIPSLFYPPHGSLFGIGFIYDEDFDDRILVAVTKLLRAHYKSIIAASEHEGVLKVYSVVPFALDRLKSWEDLTSDMELKVCGDAWYIEQYVVCGNEWVDPNKLIDSL